MQCQYCRADVPAELMGYHYAGFQMAACVEVTAAFGPEHLKHNGHVADPMLGEPKSESERAERRAARIRRWRADHPRYEKRRTPHHAGDRL